jgi:hypothetical protein
MILRKLRGGGQRNARDIKQLLALAGATEPIGEGERSLQRLPDKSRTLWPRIASQRRN